MDKDNESTMQYKSPSKKLDTLVIMTPPSLKERKEIPMLVSELLQEVHSHSEQTQLYATFLYNGNVAVMFNIYYTSLYFV